MADFPNLLNLQAAGVIHTSSSVALNAFATTASVFSVGGVWPASNRALFVPFLIETPLTAYQMAFEVTIQSGNYDIGIYDENANRLVSTGSTAVPVAGIAISDIANTVLVPGTYFMALNVDNTTAAVTRQTTFSGAALEVFGMQQQAVGAVTLPDPATFANPVAAYVPLISVALASVM